MHVSVQVGQVFIVTSQISQLSLKLLSIISIVCFIMHDKLAINKVKTVRLCLKGMINHLLYCENKITHAKVSKTLIFELHLINWCQFSLVCPLIDEKLTQVQGNIDQKQENRQVICLELLFSIAKIQ